MRNLDSSLEGRGYYSNCGEKSPGLVKMRMDVQYPSALCGSDSIIIRILETTGDNDSADTHGQTSPCEVGICLPINKVVELTQAILKCVSDDYSDLDLPEEIRELLNK
jgi:hypothetical protein